MAKKKNLEDIYYPIPQNRGLAVSEKPPIDKEVIKLIIQGAVKGAYRLKNPASWDYHGKPIKAKAVATQEQINMIVHLIESLEPTNAIEAALASQFAITYIRGMEESIDTYKNTESIMSLFEFGHKVLETLQRYRTKGAQLINVQYNHNSGQINNIKIVEESDPQTTIEVI